MYLFSVVLILEFLRNSLRKSHVGKSRNRSSIKYTIIVIDSYTFTKLS